MNRTVVFVGYKLQGRFLILEDGRLVEEPTFQGEYTLKPGQSLAELLNQQYSDHLGQIQALELEPIKGEAIKLPEGE